MDGTSRQRPARIDPDDALHRAVAQAAADANHHVVQVDGRVTVAGNSHSS